MVHKRFLFLILPFLFSMGLLLMVVQSSRSSNLRERPISQTAVSPTSNNQDSTKVEQVTSNSDGLRFSLRTPFFSVETSGKVSVAGLDNLLQDAGAPSLPYYSTYIALPPEANAAVSVKELDVSSDLVGALLPAPSPGAHEVDTALDLASDEVDGRLVSTFPSEPPPLTFVTDPAVYSLDADYPSQSYWLSKPMYIRDLRLVELRLYPLRYNPVTGMLKQSRQLEVGISFVGADWQNLRPSPTVDDSFLRSIAGSVLNFEAASGWRSLPAALTASTIPSLTVGVEHYKIELNQDGIYEISGAQLAAAGMIINTVNPATIEMIYRGQPVAYQFIGDSDGVLEANEKIRFYGWAFEGPRYEKLFVKNNVFWLRAGGMPTTIISRTNPSGMGYPAATSFLSSITKEPENHSHVTFTLWDGFPNEPDQWYWDYIVKRQWPPLTKTYSIDLPHPAGNGPDATYLVELFSTRELLAPGPPHVARAHINNDPTFGSTTWYGYADVNVTNTVPSTALISGTNQVKVVIATNFAADDIYLNRITVDYLRELTADNDQLIFSDEVGGSREFQIRNFSNGNAGNVLAWEISDPNNPVQIQIDPSDIISGGSSYTYTVGNALGSQGAKFIVTTQANILTNTQISRYTPPDTTPVSGEAEWLAITHQNFITYANQLAAHRANPAFTGLTTHVVDIDDIINRFGFGLLLPEAVQNYLRDGLANWSVAPRYVAMFGDGTLNPKNQDCLAGCSTWDKDEVNFVLTDLAFKDRFQGLIPSDHTFVLLTGNDLLADMAIGRIPVKDSIQATAVVNKIIEYETNQFTPAAWQESLVFVADNADNAGDFCAANQSTAAFIPGSFDITHLCLNPAGPISTTAILTPMMAAIINGPGASMLNFRGHGSRTTWAKEMILTTGTTDFWQNPGKPVVVMSADCHDGNFAWPNLPGLGETFLKLDNRGSAAHWSSSGIGYTWEHTILQREFFVGLFDKGLTAIGDAILYSKFQYHALGQHDSELYSFTLQGDPAMKMFRPELTFEKRPLQTDVHPGDQVKYTLTLTNTGIHAPMPTLVDSLPNGLSFVGATSPGGVFNSVSGNQLTLKLLSGVGWGESATVTVTTAVSPTFVGVLPNVVTVSDFGVNLTGATLLSDTAVITSTDEPLSGLTALNDSPTPLGMTTTLSTSLLTGTNVDYTWDFGDGMVGAGITATHVYPDKGIYTATVTATNPLNQLSATTKVTIRWQHTIFVPVITKN